MGGSFAILMCLAALGYAGSASKLRRSCRSEESRGVVLADPKQDLATEKAFEQCE